jgi:hypothetical protein
MPIPPARAGSAAARAPPHQTGRRSAGRSLGRGGGGRYVYCRVAFAIIILFAENLHTGEPCVLEAPCNVTAGPCARARMRRAVRGRGGRGSDTKLR